jgi:predicted amidophosphoribosyltransferase
MTELKSERAWRRKKSLDRILIFLRHCAICGKPGLQTPVVCHTCLFQLSLCANRGGQMEQPGYPFPVYSLWTWSDELDQLLRPLIYALKGGHCFAATLSLLEKLSFERRSIGPGENPVFVPPPRERGYEADHGWLIATHLANIWRASVWDELVRRGIKSKARGRRQKLRGAQERAELCFGTKGGLKELQNFDSIIFTDDVITSGATARAAYEALGRPNSFEVWTLVCRPKLARHLEF